MEKLIITAAICGAEVTKQNNPAVPYTVEEMDAAVDAYNEPVAQIGGSRQVFHMAAVHQVKTAVGEDNALPFGPPLLQLHSQCRHLHDLLSDVMQVFHSFRGYHSSVIFLKQCKQV